MPNLWTHLIFGQSVLHRIGKKDYIQSHHQKNVFNLGCQGPDFLFYHNFLPWKKDTKMNELGSAMHSQSCGPFLLKLIQSVKGKKHSDSALIYVLGFITHHILDRNMHPFVFYHSGFKKYAHQRFEVIMDTLIVKKMWGLDTWKTPGWMQIDTGKHLPHGTDEIFHSISKQFYPDLMKNVNISDWDQSYRDMITAWKLFHDPYYFKRVVTFGQISPLVSKRKNAPLDYFNEARKEWNDPTSLDEKYTHSVWDLWERAMEDGESVMKEVIRYLDDPGEISEESLLKTPLAEKLKNLSYETGKACDLNLEIKYVNSII